MLYLNKRQLTIVKYLLDEKKPISSDFLAVILGSNAKTIKNDMKMIGEILEFFGASLVSKSGTGYYLEVTGDKDFYTFRQTFKSKYRDNYFFPLNNGSRISYIINRLLNAGGYVKTEDIINELYISRTTLSGDIKEVKAILQSYSLAIKSRPNYGMKLSGSEIHLRHIMADYINCDEEEGLLLSTEPFHTDPLRIRSALIDKFNGMNILINTSSLTKAVNYIMISEKRYDQGKKIVLEEDAIAEFAKEPEHILALEVLRALHMDRLAADLSETTFLAILFISRRVYPPEETVDKRSKRQLFHLANKIEDLIYTHIGIDLFSNTNLKDVLYKHLRGLVVRLRFNIEKKDLPLLQIKQSSPAFEIAVLVCSFISQYYNCPMPESEIAYIAYTFNPFYSRHISIRKINVLVIMWSGLVVAKDTKDLLYERFHTIFDTVGCIEFYQLKFTNIDAFDCIITDIPLINFDVPIPVMQVSSLNEPMEKTRLFNFFSMSRLRYQEFISCFREDLFFSGVQINTKQGVLEFLCKKIMEADDTIGDIYDLVMNRESFSATESDTIVATPHTLYCKDGYTYIAVCILKKPALWDKEYVQAVFLTVNGSYDTYAYLNLSILKGLLYNKDFVYNLIKNPGYNYLIKAVNTNIAGLNLFV